MLIGALSPATCSPVRWASAPVAAAPDPDRFLPSEGEGPPIQGPRRFPTLSLVCDQNAEPRSIGRGNFRSEVPLLLARDAAGQTLVLKVEPARTPEERAKRNYWWAAQLLASLAFQRLGANAVPYSYGRAEHQGKVLEGLASPFRQFALLSEHSDPIKSPDQVIRGLVINAWLGDYDRIVKDDNVWVEPGGEVLLGDVGCAAMPGVKAFGAIPKVHLELFSRCATPENVAAAVADVVGLSDGEIRRLASEAVAQLPDANSAMAENLARVLIENRQELRQGNVFEPLMGGQVPDRFAMPEEKAAALVDAVTGRYERYAGEDPAVVACRAMEGIRGYAPMQGRDLELAELQLSNAIDRRNQGRPCQLELAPSCFFVWHELTKRAMSPRQTLQLDLGLKHANPTYIKI
ncbi:hypothetical protein DYH09_05195 [bacterium CPR1]|nr:hypothetical protein [bacterium CPR1]